MPARIAAPEQGVYHTVYRTVDLASHLVTDACCLIVAPCKKLCLMVALDIEQRAVQIGYCPLAQARLQRGVEHAQHLRAQFMDIRHCRWYRRHRHRRMLGSRFMGGFL
jgi:hypothetical protein